MLVGFTLLSLLQVFHVYAEKVHIHSVFIKTLNFLLVWTSFLAFSFHCVCSLYVWMKFARDAGRSSPNVVEIPPNHIHQKKNVFFHIHEINTDGCVVY